MQFSDSEWLRYTRHLQLSQVGVAGQKKLKSSRVMIVGLGGLGSPVALYLAAAGVGKLTLVDHDHVDLSNLQRQIVFSVDSVGQLKVHAARDRLLALNDCTGIEAIAQALTSDNAQSLTRQHDLVIDCSDNFATRYAINTACLLTATPWLFASIDQFNGQTALFTPNEGDENSCACFQCLYPTMPEDLLDCNEAGVLGVLPGLLGSLQANEALKYLLGLPCPLKNHLMTVDALKLRFQRIRLSSDSKCPACGSGSLYRKRSVISISQQCVLDGVKSLEMSVSEFNKKQQNNDHLQLMDVRTTEEHEAFHIGGFNLPLDSLMQEGMHTLKTYISNKNTLILCYCQTGARSKKAAKFLSSQGFSALSLQGGLLAYLRAKE